MLTAFAFTRRLAPIRLPARSLMPISRYIASGDTEESKKKAAEYSRQYREKKDAISQRSTLFYEKNKEARSQRDKLRYEKNRDAICQKSKVYREGNKDAIKQYHKVYRKENKDAIKQYNRGYSEENKDALKQYRKIYQEENKDAINQLRKLYRDDNKDAINQKHKLYCEENFIHQKSKVHRTVKREKTIHRIRTDIADDPSHAQHLLSEEEVDELYHHFLLEEKQEIFGGQTLAQAIASGKWTFYFGISKTPGAEERLLCLSMKEARLRPVLLKTDGTKIQEGYAKLYLRPEVVVLYRSRLVFNTLELLWRLQETYRDLPLGYRRLNRYVGIHGRWTGDVFCQIFVNF
ncbi:hypothetical protein B484DRAFT_396888 [Ochromonadaceae sp. CCMP2298]|nr:hypothetical protein B484DRAFT_396888 [Ochromonadaceae sp. CCMP2298]